MTELWIEPCPRCDCPSEVCVDEYGNPVFNSWGLGYTYYCEDGCQRHFNDRRKRPKGFLEEEPEPEGAIEP